MLSSITQRLKGRSMAQIVQLVGHNIAYHAREMTPQARRRNRQFRAFDAQWGTDTFGMRELHTLSVDPDLAVHARRYQASNGGNMPTWFADLNVDFARTAFIDFGCGKGRAVLEAARFPFARVIGVEFAPELVEIAERNRAIMMARGALAAPVEFVCMDAGRYEPPTDLDLVCFFYDPFGDAVMAPVADRLTALDQPVSIIYLEPNCIGQFRRSGRWTEGVSVDNLVLRNPAALAR
ncbi:class I SAM-dependent methyltransferase [Sphingomonas sp. 35-24ZXX]|uniref:class I SAM-dependent methyltransferase n=1 Tax=Sphingomonas sp. 35-24ZXX TaxID=1545915 RepID=UPI00068F8800|nr:class I SAM-dependent methyltransferase [Sphingomonas sp. 35-24ZXX]